MFDYGGVGKISNGMEKVEIVPHLRRALLSVSYQPLLGYTSSSQLCFLDLALRNISGLSITNVLLACRRSRQLTKSAQTWRKL